MSNPEKVPVSETLSELSDNLMFLRNEYKLYMNQLRDSKARQTALEDQLLELAQSIAVTNTWLRDYPVKANKLVARIKRFDPEWPDDPAKEYDHMRLK